MWDKGQRIQQSDGELAYTSLDGALRIWTLNRIALKQDGAQHPTQKPEELMRWCIQQADPAETILDPFAGSGTTGRAAKDLGRTAVLIDREERYCEIAAGRMAQMVFRLDTNKANLERSARRDDNVHVEDCIMDKTEDQENRTGSLPVSLPGTGL